MFKLMMRYENCLWPCMTLILCSFNDWWRKPWETCGTPNGRVENGHNSIRVHENALWRRDTPIFYALSYWHEVETRQPSMCNHIVIKWRHDNLLCVIILSWRGDTTTFYVYSYCDDVETRRPSMCNHISMTWRHGNLLCVIILSWRGDTATFYALSYWHDVETRQPSTCNHIGMKWRHGNLLCVIILS